jgi:ACS family hexuronate transporter-like MFS transporter
MMLVSLISYIDRNTLALLAPTILKETGLSAEQYGWIISAFSVAYMAGNPFWGRLLDTVGLRGGMAAAVAFWTAASASHAFAGGFWALATARAALGSGRLQSRGIALAYSGGSLGAIVTPIIITPIAAHWGWRSAFWFTGLVGLAWLVLWSAVSRRPDIRARSDLQPASSSRLPGPRWLDPHIWSFMAAYALGALPLGFILYDASIYLNRALGATQEEIGRVLWIPPLGWEAGYFVWGWLADRTVRRASRLSAYRTLLGAATLLSLPLALTPQLPSLAMVMAALFFAMFVAAGFVILTISYATYVYSSEHAGLIAGLGAGSWAAVVALAMPVFGRLIDGSSWKAAFGLAALFPVAGYAIWRLLNRGPEQLAAVRP